MGGYWMNEDTPERGRALVLGIFGGIAGALAMRWYWANAAEKVIPSDLPATTDLPLVPDIDNISIAGKNYHAGESVPEALARISYKQLLGSEPSSTEKSALSELIFLAHGIAAGAAYGGTRTTTGALDPLATIFYGMRLWAGSTFLPAVLGLRPVPTSIPLKEHLMRLTAYWVYTAVTTTITRLLYKATE